MGAALTRKIMTTIALATGGFVCLIAMAVSGAIALFSLLSGWLGPAWAGAALAGAAAAVLALAAIAASALIRPRRRSRTARRTREAEASSGLAAVLGLLRDRPVLTVAGGLVAAVLAARDPDYVGAALRSFLSGREPRR